MSSPAQTPQTPLAADVLDVVSAALRDARRRAGVDVERYDLLARPGQLPDSPFLTLAEYRERCRIPSSVVKVLMIPSDGYATSHEWWHGKLEHECRTLRERLRDEYELTVGETEQRSTPIVVKRVPLTRGPVVEIVPNPRAKGGKKTPESTPTPERTDQLWVEPRRFFRADTPEAANGTESLVLPYLVRPYIAWPVLHQTGYVEDRQRAIWEQFCKERKVDGKSLAERMPELHRGQIFAHFARHALIREVFKGATPSSQAVRYVWGGKQVVVDVILASSWRLDGLPMPSRRGL